VETPNVGPEKLRRTFEQVRSAAALKAELVSITAQVEHLGVLVGADCLKAAAATASDIAERCTSLKIAQLAAQQELALEERAASAQAAFSFAL
jgi:hypothetical protein